MQTVSAAYKESMKSTLRERGYILVTFHLVNQEAQENSTLEESEQTYFSNDENILAGSVTGNRVYATLEQDFTKVDGSMYFLPREDSALALSSIYDTGIISSDLISNAQWSLTINTNVDPIDFKGLTIKWGENYPTAFDIICDTGQTLSVTDNEESEWNTEEVFEEITSLTIVVYTMKNENNRARIYEITFGYDLEYENDDVSDSSLESYISPVCLDVPQLDFTVTLNNYDQYFNVDNPDSAINFLETGQKIEVKYGYETPDADDIEWIEGSVLICSSWESDNTTATIIGTDFLRTQDNDYYKGICDPNGTSFYDLAVDVFEDANISDYYIESTLKDLYTKNPLPKVSHKEALQIIANACRCVLMQSRVGRIQIKSNYVPDMAITSNGETEYSNVDNVLAEGTKEEYATPGTNYVSADGLMYFMPTDGNYTINTAYVSEQVSDENCEFEDNPIITVQMEAVRAYYAISLVFGYAIPAAFTLRSYNDDVLVSEYSIESDEISKTCTIVREFYECDKIEIEFTKTSETLNHIVLNYLSLDTAASFTMELIDMQSYPLGTKQDLIKDVIVPCSIYQEGTTTLTLASDELTVEEGEEEIYYFSSASHGYELSLTDTETEEDVEDGVEIVESGAYYIKVRFLVSGTYIFKVTGSNYNVTQKNATYTLSSRGESVTWENPLIDDMDKANDLATWLGEYYACTIEYEYDTRGNPELDANDIIYQENDYEDDMKVLITEAKLTFNGGFGGSVVARKVNS